MFSFLLIVALLQATVQAVGAEKSVGGIFDDVEIIDDWFTAMRERTNGFNSLFKDFEDIPDEDESVPSGKVKMQPRMMSTRGFDDGEDDDEGYEGVYGRGNKIPDGCYWDGMIPWCDGSCDKDGYAEWGRYGQDDESGMGRYAESFGIDCVFGEKALCCPIDAPDYLVVTDHCHDAGTYNGKYIQSKMHNGKYTYKSYIGDVIYHVPIHLTTDRRTKWVIGDGTGNVYATTSQRAQTSVRSRWDFFPPLYSHDWKTMCHGRAEDSVWDIEGYSISDSGTWKTAKQGNFHFKGDRYYALERDHVANQRECQRMCEKYGKKCGGIEFFPMTSYCFVWSTENALNEFVHASGNAILQRYERTTRKFPYDYSVAVGDKHDVVSGHTFKLILACGVFGTIGYAAATYLHSKQNIISEGYEKIHGWA